MVRGGYVLVYHHFGYLHPEFRISPYFCVRYATVREWALVCFVDAASLGLVTSLGETGTIAEQEVLTSSV